MQAQTTKFKKDEYELLLKKFYLLKFLKLLLSVDKLETFEVSGAPVDIGFAIGQTDADSIQKQVLQLAEFRETERTWHESIYLKMLDAAARNFF